MIKIAENPSTEPSYSLIHASQQLSEDLQIYFNKSRSTVYILLDTTVDSDKLKQFAEMLKADLQVRFELDSSI